MWLIGARVLLSPKLLSKLIDAIFFYNIASDIHKREDTLYTVGGVGELYQRRSTLL
jgi:hypothetical protein